MLQDTGQLVPVEATVDAGAAHACSPFSPLQKMPAPAFSAHPSPKGCRRVPGSLQGRGIIHTIPYPAAGLGLTLPTPTPPIPAPPGHGALASAR